MRSVESRASRLMVAALEYARHGWRVLPLVKRGKRPVTPHGVHDATNDVAYLHDYWAADPELNVGLACDGWVALDVDARSGGLDSIRELCARYGSLPKDAVQRTGGGGWHVLFADPGLPLRGRLADWPGVEWKGAGGYIVAAPSVHESGDEYRWHGPWDQPALGDLREIPEWLLTISARDVPTMDRPAPHLADDCVVARARAYARTLDPAIQGSHGSAATFRAAASIARGFGLGADWAYQILAGEYNPRCIPPWSERELRRKCREAEAYGTQRWGELAERDRPV